MRGKIDADGENGEALEKHWRSVTLSREEVEKKLENESHLAAYGLILSPQASNSRTRTTDH